MRCRFCDTEIADKALICFRCGRATQDARVAPPPVARGLSGPVAATVAAVALAAGAGVEWVAEGAAAWAGWTVSAVSTLLAGALWWGGRAGRR
jgi:hypothetical protein